MAVLGSSFRTYALDFWGFGESGPRRASYAIQDFVSLVDQFMGHLGISKAPLVGHSMGGTVCLLVAILHPERVQRAVVIGSPIVGSSVHFFPRVFGYRLFGWLAYHNLWMYKSIYRLLASRYSKDPNWVRIMDRDVSRTTLEAFFASIGSLRQTDLLGGLKQINVPVLGMYGGRDNIVDPSQWELLQESVPHALIDYFPGAGHFIMLDEPARFVERLEVFLNEIRVS
jgi:pimeloyl-ACP methyl ester carboxylesterase